MPFCKKCGTAITEDAEFCSACGTPAADTGKPGAQPVEPAGQQPPETDAFKTVVRKKPVYGVVNLGKLPQGYLIDDRYEIIEKLGQGGFGAVYRAFDKKMEIDKALKVLPEAVTSDLEAMESLKAEATTMVRLNHPNIVRVYDFQDKGEIKYIDMEFVDGKNLTEVKLQKEEKKLSEKAVANLGKKIAKGLAYAHKQNVIHRDIKPQNILVPTSGDVKIMDFGISETVKSSMSRIANSGSSGTLVYMPPEQIVGKDVGKEADIYSFGAMLYELLSGKTPFYKGAIEHQILNIEPTEIDGISKKVNNFLLTCLAKDYTDRYRNFDDVLLALDGNPGRVGSARQKSEKPKKVLRLILLKQPKVPEPEKNSSLPASGLLPSSLPYLLPCLSAKRKPPNLPCRSLLSNLPRKSMPAFLPQRRAGMLITGELRKLTVRFVLCRPV